LKQVPVLLRSLLLDEAALTRRTTSVSDKLGFVPTVMVPVTPPTFSSSLDAFERIKIDPEGDKECWELKQDALINENQR
jgi:hypothetical protein